MPTTFDKQIPKKRSMSDRRRAATSQVGQRVKDRAKNEIKQRAKKVAKKAVKSGAKNLARVATGSASIAVEAAFALLFSKAGKKVMKLAFIAWACIWFGIILIVFNLFASNSQQRTEVSDAATTSSEKQASSTLGITSGTNYQLLIAEESKTGIPWEIPLAIAYYETMGGQSVASQPSQCPSNTALLFCPPTSSVPATPLKHATGEFGLLTAKLSTLGLTPATATNTTAAVVAIDHFLVKQLKQRGVPSRANIMSGISYNSQNQPVAANTRDASAYSKAMIGAIEALPLANNSSAMSSNIYYISQEWAESVPAPQNIGGGGPLLICAGANGKTVSITDNTGGKMTLDPEQVTNAVIIGNVAKSMGISPEGVVYALAIALRESSLFDYPNGAIPASLSYPGAQLGGYSPSNPPGNGTSLGLFQQQNNWGSIAQRMNPAESSKLFFQRLLGVHNWQSDSLTQIVTIVQAPLQRYVKYYAQWQTGAATLAGDVLHISCSSGMNTSNLTGVAKAG